VTPPARGSLSCQLRILLENQPVELRPKEPGANVPERIKFMRNREVPMRVQQRPYQAVTAPRIPDEQSETLHLAERTVPWRAGDCRPNECGHKVRGRKQSLESSPQFLSLQGK
jgi:hypothetical protein